MTEKEMLLAWQREERSKFLVLGDGETVQVKYRGCVLVPDEYPDAEYGLLRYDLELDGIEKYLMATSQDEADQLSQIPVGSEISVRRTGEGLETRYFITLVPDGANKEGHNDKRS